jgi:hypothetical protein
MTAAPRLLVVVGSGETSPTMVSLHQRLVGGLGARPQAFVVETPYGFQENADEVSHKTLRYFAGNVGFPVQVAPGLRAPADEQGPDLERGVAAVRSAAWLFAGPGSPSYAIRHWQGSPVAQALRDRLKQPGITVFASAAACCLGDYALPVYEIYKVGATPAWLEGLGLLRELDIEAAFVPHYNNAEGGTHDTRYCYMGERRLRMLEQHLPPEAAILGLDEHTAAIFDLAAQTVSVHGRGKLTVRRGDTNEELSNGAAVSLPELRQLVSGATRAAPPRPAMNDGAGNREAGELATMDEAARACERRYGDAEQARDAETMVSAILELEETLAAWSTDTLDTDQLDRARAVLRSLVTRLGMVSERGLRDPAEGLAPVVEPLLAVRGRLRERGDYALADAVRDALSAGGVEIKDTRQGSRWELARSP